MRRGTASPGSVGAAARAGAGRSRTVGRALTVGVTALALSLLALPGIADAETATPTPAAGAGPTTTPTGGSASAAADPAAADPTVSGPTASDLTASDSASPGATEGGTAAATDAPTGSGSPTGSGTAEPTSSPTPDGSTTAENSATATPTTSVTPTPSPTASALKAEAPTPQPLVLDKVVSKIDAVQNPTLTGTVSPAQADVLIHIDVQQSDGKFRPKMSTTTDANGKFTLPFSYGNGSLASYTIRAGALPPGATKWLVTPGQKFTRIQVFNPVVTKVNADDVKYTYRAGCPVGPSKLREVSMNFYGFDKKMHRGAILIRSDLTDDLTRGFKKALDHHYPIRRMDNPDIYKGSDPVQMEADNSSGFNCRKVTGNPYAQSPHSYGIALDVNTVENPYRDVTGKWWPKKGKKYIKRSPRKPGMLIKESYLTSSLRGDDFFWGGFWNPGRDYQHFEYRP